MSFIYCLISFHYVLHFLQYEYFIGWYQVAVYGISGMQTKCTVLGRCFLVQIRGRHSCGGGVSYIWAKDKSNGKLEGQFKDSSYAHVAVLFNNLKNKFFMTAKLVTN